MVGFPFCEATVSLIPPCSGIIIASRAVTAAQHVPNFDINIVPVILGS